MNQSVRASLEKVMEGLDISLLTKEQLEDTRAKFEILMQSHKDDIAYIETVLERLK